MKRFNKDRSRAATKRFDTDISAIIYSGLVHDVPKRKVYAQIRREVAFLASECPGISIIEKGYLWSTALRAYSLSAKQAHFGLKKAKSGINYQKRLKMRSETAFKAVKHNLIASNELTKAENDVLNRIEAREKMSELENLGKESIFFLCDVHESCASDHKLYQGRLYIRENWELYVDDPQLAAQVNAYLHNHPYMRKQTLEWVLGLRSDNKDPSPYLVRRPNCKHKLVPVTIEEVLHSSVRKLLHTKKLIHDNEADRSAADRPYRAYKERLDTLKELWKVMPNEMLGKEIAETKKLAVKWGRIR